MLYITNGGKKDFRKGIERKYAIFFIPVTAVC